MTRRHAAPDGDEADPDPGALQERMRARGLGVRTAATGGTLIHGDGLTMHFADAAGAMAASREPDPDKVFATLQARLALAGWSLLQDGPGGFLAARWGRCVHLGDLQGVEAFAQRVGAVSTTGNVAGDAAVSVQRVGGQ